MKTQNNEPEKLRLIAYVRKSTDEKGKQIRSIKDQKIEIREFLKLHEDVELIDIIEEKKSARFPGRSVFNKMLERIKACEADGILAWHPDRLARNSVDAGLILYMLDMGVIKDLKFVSWRFENTPQGKQELGNAFVESKHMTDKLSVDVMRGIHLKLKEGGWPNLAPPGYKNNKYRKTIYLDKKRASFIKKTYELYATDRYSFRQIRKIMGTLGLKTRKGTMLSVSQYQFILQNPFYHGVMKLSGQLYEGKHQPIISKKLFDKVQKIIEHRSTWKNRKKLKHFVYRGLLRCGECGYAITAMKKTKKSGKQYTYYLCTRNSPHQVCTQRQYTREENVSAQIKEAIQKVSLPDSWTNWMIKELKKEKEGVVKESLVFTQKVNADMSKIDQKIERLTDALAEETLTSEEFLTTKNKLVNQKQLLKGKLIAFEEKGYNWFEPAMKFIKSLKQREISRLQGNDEQARDFLQKIALNPCLTDNKLSLEYKSPFKILAETEPERSEGEVVEGKFKKTSMLCSVWDFTRTFFQENPDTEF